jgi:hypothetical protein
MSKIFNCRSCSSKKIVSLFSLGTLYFTGFFLKNRKSKAPKGKLTIVICLNCKLVQLDRNFSLKFMYGSNYGYRTGLNKSMVDHIKLKAEYLNKNFMLKKKMIILDIGSNDGTLLNFFKNKNYTLIGVDPTIAKFKKFYDRSVNLIPNFFSKEIFKKRFLNKKVDVVTSIAMFYDLTKPDIFVKDIYEILDDNGIWHFEVSYLPLMLKTFSFDTICHEHLEYYSLKSLKYILDKNDMKIIDIKFNNVNGGSIALTVSKKQAIFKEKKIKIQKVLKKEKKLKIYNISTYKIFFNKINLIKENTLKYLDYLKKQKKIIAGYGASTKGNVFLQYFNINSKYLNFIFDVNKDKKNHYTPGTIIKIIPEINKIMSKVDYFLVMPWHFRKFIISKEKKLIKLGKKFIFILPNMRIN